MAIASASIAASIISFLILFTAPFLRRDSSVPHVDQRGHRLALGDVGPYAQLPAIRVLLNATTKAEEAAVIAEVDAVVAEVVATTVVAKADAVVVKVEAGAEAEEAAAAQHKVVSVSEVCLISLSRPGANHHCGHKSGYRKNHKHTSHNVCYLLLVRRGCAYAQSPAS